ncbi:MAG: SDR family oxidoreductase [Ilumatobacteraceae bacterium]|nr:SDR family oxidoreductase [Ilumatobacteraceae bacterium]
MAQLTNEIALVTGATGGLGRIIALTLARRGAAVAVHGRDDERGARLVADIRHSGGTADFFAADLTSSDAATRMVDAVVSTFGRLSILVNSAYASDDMADDASVGEITDEAWDNILTGNLTTSLWVTRAALTTMTERGRGSIVNISARAGVVGTPGMAAHAASKGAINALTRSIAVDYADRGIRCNAVVPGHILHEVRDANASAERIASLEAMQLTRLATPEDVANSVAFLAGPDAEVLTGVLLPVDGGSTAARAAVVGGPDPRCS